MTKLLTQNSKIKKMGGPKTKNFGIPALRLEIDGELFHAIQCYLSRNEMTWDDNDLIIKQQGDKGYLYLCPKAKQCAGGCYALSGAYKWSNVHAAYRTRLIQYLTDSETFFKRIKKELGKASRIRIHDSGDFFSKTYAQDWLKFMVSNQDTLFYAYTKQVSLFKSLTLPNNFTVIFSEGGAEDSLIDTEVDRHSRVFLSETELVAAGYADASQDDNVATLANLKVGLVWHGVSKKKAWTTNKKSQNETGETPQDGTKKIA